MNIYIHPIAKSQFKGEGVGTFVSRPVAMQVAIEETLENYDMPENGQGFVSLPEECIELVEPGVMLRAGVPIEKTKVVEHRDEFVVVADRNKVLPGRADGVAAIVYTAAAFLSDPQTSDEEKELFINEGYTHAWVTTLAFKGPQPPVTSRRFVRNLAGGNAAYADKTVEELVAEAKAIEQYEKEWILVG